MKPSIGRIVHYVSHGTPVGEDGKQAFSSQCRAAIVTEVHHVNLSHVGLSVFNPTGMFFHPLAAGGCMQDESSAPNRKSGTWHWPERAERGTESSSDMTRTPPEEGRVR